MSKEENTVFISHSSKDTKLINLAEFAFDNRDIKPYFAKNRMEGKNPVDKIVDAICKAKGFFALITPNVTNDTHTRDWVNFEIGVARAKQMRIFVWIDKSVLQNKLYPRLLENVTDYTEFDSQSDDDCCKVITSIRSQALNFDTEMETQEKNSNHQLTETTIDMDDAQKIAEEFILSRKREYTKIDISSTEPKSDGWIVKGSISRSSAKSGGSEHWTIVIKGKDIFSYEFKPGPSWALGKIDW